MAPQHYMPMLPAQTATVSADDSATMMPTRTRFNGRMMVNRPQPVVGAPDRRRAATSHGRRQLGRGLVYHAGRNSWRAKYAAASRRSATAPICQVKCRCRRCRYFSAAA